MIKVARRSKNTITPRLLLLLLTQDLDLNSVLYLLAGVLEDIQTDFNVGDDKGGLLQTAFVISYMIFAPLFGYLGDRYSRRAIMAFGVFLWGVTTLLGSFMQVCNPPHRYGFCNLFLRHHIYF
jgi:MFS family permease